MSDVSDLNIVLNSENNLSLKISNLQNTGTEINNQDIIITPSIEKQNIVADEGYTGIGSITVNAVTSEIDDNIVESNIKSGISILGVTGTVEEVNNQNLEVTENGTYIPDNGYTGFNEVTVNVEGVSSKVSVSGAGLFASYLAPTFTASTNSGAAGTSMGTVYMLPYVATYFTNINDYFEPFTSAESMFFNCGYFSGSDWGLSDEITFDISHIKFQNLSSTKGMFNQSSTKTYFSAINLGNLDTSKVTNMSGMFRYCSGLTSLDVSSLNTSKVTDMSGMFSYCKGLTSLDVSSFDTSNVTNTILMFYYCTDLTSLDVSSFDTSNVTNMATMFGNCSSLTSLDVSNFNTSNATHIGYMFTSCSSLTSLDLSNFDTNNVVHMSDMFNTCSSLTSLDLSNFDTTNTKYMANMFYNCSKLTSLDLSSFTGTTATTCTGNSSGTASAKNVYRLFYGCTSLQTLDISGLDWRCTSSNVFTKCTALETVYVKDEDSKTACDTALSNAGLSIESTIKE